MEKNDLRTGMLITYRDGRKGVVFLETNSGNAIGNLDTGHFVKMSDIGQDLKCSNTSNSDIMKVEKLHSVTDLIFYISGKTPFREPETIFTRDEEKEKLTKIIDELKSQLEDAQSKLIKL